MRADHAGNSFLAFSAALTRPGTQDERMDLFPQGGSTRPSWGGEKVLYFFLKIVAGRENEKSEQQFYTRGLRERSQGFRRARGPNKSKQQFTHAGKTNSWSKRNTVVLLSGGRGRPASHSTAPRASRSTALRMRLTGGPPSPCGNAFSPLWGRRDPPAPYGAGWRAAFSPYGGGW